MSAAVPVLDRPQRGPRSTNGAPIDPPPPSGGDGHEDEPERRRPLLDNAVVAVIFLMGGETMFFAGLVSAFWVLRLGAAAWPPPLQPRLPVAVTGLNTLVLFASSVVLVAALRAHGRGDRRGSLGRLGVACGLGALFLFVQGAEWIRLIGFGLTMSSSAYGTTFYGLIGAHAVHVVAALIWLAAMVAAVLRGRLAGPRPAALRACALYWHFVVALWPILYLTVYVL